MGARGGRAVLTRTSPCWHPPQLSETFLSLKPPGLWRFVMAAQADKDSLQKLQELASREVTKLVPHTGLSKS